MNPDFENAYKIYVSCVNGLKTLRRVSTSDLNKLYNVSCRARRDSKYASDLKSGKEDILELIELFFNEYNNLYGLEIRDSLIEFQDTSMAFGSYFEVESYALCDGEKIPRAPTEFKINETAYLTLTLISYGTGAPISAAYLSLSAKTDDGEVFEKKVQDTSTVDLTLSLRRPGCAMITVEAKNENGEVILGSESACAGVLFSREEIFTAHTPPTDLYDFWDGRIRALMDTDPRGTEPDGYSGEVATLYGMPEKNRFSVRKLDSEYLEMLRQNAQSAPTEEELTRYDVYELVLKSPGPCPSTGYVSIPKGAKSSSLPIHVSYDGYSVRSPAPFLKEGCIEVHCSHHGYELGQNNSTYYEKLRKTVCSSYCLGNGAVNSDCKNIYDCYPLYIMLRDLQMIRFLTDPSLSFDIEGLDKVWSGDIILWGSSMGGYQSLAVGGLMSIMKKYSAPYKSLTVEAGSPAFADVAGHTEGRIKSTFFTYGDGVDYFDTAILATLIDSPTSIFRASLGDPICTASSMSAIYNMIPTRVKKEIKYVQNSSHGYIPSPEHQRWYTY